MALFTDAQRSFCHEIARLSVCNPFLPERIECEQAALGDEYVEQRDGAWNVPDGRNQPPLNLLKIQEKVEALSAEAAARLSETGGRRVSGRDRELYESLILFLLFHRHHQQLTRTIEQGLAGGEDASPPKVTFYAEFESEANRLLGALEPASTLLGELDHIFACLFQVRRAFHNIFDHILGASPPAVRLRAAVWQSIFTHDLGRYRRSYYRRIGDVTTLITGRSGTGKELVARAIGLSRYIRFDAASRRFEANFAGSFLPLNLSALSPTLIESELFGHRRGAFTGAVADRPGWLEVCPEWGAVFLDEIGDLDATIQVKLLRALQSRGFQRIGETQQRRFTGKIIAATNRDLDAEMQQGRFREDFYYRLCSDILTTPGLAEQLQHAAGELRRLIGHIAARVTGEDSDDLADEVTRWIEANLPADYGWPGNFRELEQCVRNVMIRGSYRPASTGRTARREDGLPIAAIKEGALTCEQLLRDYCAHVYMLTGSYEATARRLGVDRRTVKARVQAARRPAEGPDHAAAADPA